MLGLSSVGGAFRDGKMKQVSAMMAGVVIEILVKVGDPIKVGTAVAVLESMKMQLPVESGLEGRVREITVKLGAFVNEGDPLLHLE